MPSRFVESDASDVAHALGGTLDGFLQDEYPGIEVVDGPAFLVELTGALRRHVGIPGEESVDGLVESVIHGYAENSLEVQASDDDPYELGRDLSFEEYVVYWVSEFLQEAILAPQTVLHDMAFVTDEYPDVTIDRIVVALANVVRG